MKQILGIIGSPRKLGNCEIMVKEISRQISIPHELKLLRLQDFKILPCRGCYHCLFKTGHCVIEDDLATVVTAIVEADALIVSAPTYFLGINSCIKQFLDRGLSLLAHIEKLWHKPAVGVVIAGIEGKEGYSLLAIQSFLKLILAENKQSRIVYGALPGEVFMNPENKQMAAELAGAFFEPCVEKKGALCPLCGGDTFRFIENNRVQCMLCSNTGIMTVQDNAPAFEINKSDHELFLSKEEAVKHREWLLGMKSRFIEQKKALKEITQSYIKQGSWVKP
ncbi:MAG: flavodoxin family protein [Desulfobacterales bacterium]|jgi:multimeric flavodoxin WrbA